MESITPQEALIEQKRATPLKRSFLDSLKTKFNDLRGVVSIPPNGGLDVINQKAAEYPAAAERTERRKKKQRKQLLRHALSVSLVGSALAGQLPEGNASQLQAILNEPTPIVRTVDRNVDAIFIDSRGEWYNGIADLFLPLDGDNFLGVENLSSSPIPGLVLRDVSNEGDFQDKYISQDEVIIVAVDTDQLEESVQELVESSGVQLKDDQIATIDENSPIIISGPTSEQAAAPYHISLESIPEDQRNLEGIKGILRQNHDLEGDEDSIDWAAKQILKGIRIIVWNGGGVGSKYIAPLVEGGLSAVPSFGQVGEPGLAIQIYDHAALVAGEKQN